MNRLVVLAAAVCGLLVAGCGTSSGLQVENNGTTTRITKSTAAQPQVDSLDAVAFPTAGRGWAAGDGAIIATTDGGATWTQQYAGSADIRSLDFADPRHGWAVAARSLLRTADGGMTWSTVAEPDGLVLTSVVFAGTDQGWGVALPAGDVGEQVLGSLVATTDGGSSWTVVKSGIANSICVSGGALVAGAGSRVLRSTDGGATWRTLLDAGRNPQEGWLAATVQCPDLQSLWVMFQGGAAAGSQAYAALTSRDAGTAWQPAVAAPMLVGSDPALAGAAPLDAYAGPFAAVSASTAVFLGACPACDPQRVTVLRTHDGGERWERSVVNGFAPTGLSFADAEHGWMTTVIGGAEGHRPAILATADGGRTWRPVYPS